MECAHGCILTLIVPSMYRSMCTFGSWMPSVKCRGSLLYCMLYCMCVWDVGSVPQNAATEEPQQYKLWYNHNTYYQGAASGYEEMCTKLQYCRYQQTNYA